MTKKEFLSIHNHLFSSAPKYSVILKYWMDSLDMLGEFYWQTTEPQMVCTLLAYEDYEAVYTTFEKGEIPLYLFKNAS